MTTKQIVAMSVLTLVLIVGLVLPVVLAKQAQTTLIPKPSPVVHSSYYAPVHPVLKYSITPGGVWSAEQAHMKHGHIEVLKQDLHVYVNYRRNGMVWWTRRPIVVRAGETVVTDGKTTLRSRCGNTISKTPQVPTEIVDVADVLDLPEVDSGELRLRQLSSALIPPYTYAPETVSTPSGTSQSGPGSTSGGPGGYPGIYPPSFPPGGSGGDKPPVPTPEPGTFVLLGTGLVAVWKTKRRG